MTHYRDRPDTCAVCGIEYPLLERDHIIPRSLGGEDAPANIQWLCPNCHRLKTSHERSQRKRPPITEETRERIREAALKRWQRPEYRERVRTAVQDTLMGRAPKIDNTGRRLTDEHRARLSVALKGKPKPERTPEHSAAIKAAWEAKGYSMSKSAIKYRRLRAAKRAALA